VLVAASADVRRFVTWPLATVATCLLALAAFTWDQRTQWTSFIETTEAPPEALSSLLPEHELVYWEGDVRVPWLVLKRSSYFSCAQGTGALFFRGTAVAYQHRYETLKQLRTLDFGQETTCPSPGDQASYTLYGHQLASICTEEPKLGALVLTRPIVGVPSKEWQASVKFEDVRPVDGRLQPFSTDKFFIYSCASVRRSPLAHDDQPHSNSDI
jgi:hypothetical protein